MFRARLAIPMVLVSFIVLLYAASAKRVFAQTPPSSRPDYWQISVQPSLSAGATDSTSTGENSASLEAGVTFMTLPFQAYTVDAGVTWNFTATWVAPDGAPPPSQVLVTEQVQGQWDTDQEAINGAINASYGFQSATEFQSHGVIHGINYQILPVNNNQVQWSLDQNSSVEAHCFSAVESFDPSSAEDYDTLNIANLDVETSGGVDSPTVDNLLTGQLCTATVDDGDLVPLTYTWASSSGTAYPFESWTYSFNNGGTQGDFVDMGKVPTSNASYTSQFCRHDVSSGVKFNCAVTSGVPQTPNVVTKPANGLPKIAVLQRVPIDVKPVTFVLGGLQKSDIVLK